MSYKIDMLQSPACTCSAFVMLTLQRFVVLTLQATFYAVHVIVSLCVTLLTAALTI
jgi:hypothetical protein